MKELRTFYAKWLTFVALAVGLGTHFLSTITIPNHWAAALAEVVISRPGLVALIAGAEWLIRNKLWRWLHPELDFSGTWDGVSTYTHRHVGDGAIPAPVNHEARIEQDCLSFRLIPAKGDRFVRFESTSSNLIDAHRLVYSYNVVYKNDEGFPTETYGYEEMSPTDDPDDKGRPKILQGWFAHCVRSGQKAAFSGTVIFTRRIA